MRKILLVDDEADVLASLARALMDPRYLIETALSGEEALNKLDRQCFDLVITDMRMPGMDGFSLLSQVKVKCPETIRMLLSGMTDEKTVFKALLQNVATIYYYKPWKDAKLREVIEQLFVTEDQLKNVELSKYINKLNDIPTIKSSCQRIISMIDGDCEFVQLAAEIEKDQAIAVRILRVVNSAYYGVSTGSILDAIKLLGLQNIRIIVLSVSLIEQLAGAGEGASMISNLWDHAFLTNTLLHSIYLDYLKKRIPEISSAAGLLHNIGVVVMLANDFKSYAAVYKKVIAQGGDLISAEKEALHVSHAELGGYFLKWWGLPYPLVEAALYNYVPSDPRVIEKELVAAVHVASKIARDKIGMKPFYDCDPDALTTLGMTEADVVKLTV